MNCPVEAGLSLAGPLRIAVLAREPIDTGVASVAVESARQFRQAGHDVRLVVDVAPAVPLPGIPVDVTPLGPLLHRWRPRGRVGFRIRQLVQVVAFSVFASLQANRLRKQGYVTIDHNMEACGGDIVVVHSVFHAQYQADRRSRLRRLHQFLNPLFHLRLVRERLVLQSARVRAVVAVSEDTLREVSPLIHDRSKAVSVIRSGVNASRYRPLGPDERQTGRRAQEVDGKFVVLFVGHEFERKRLDLVLLALSRLPESVVAWVIGGRMSRLSAYMVLADSLGLRGRVRFMGTRSDAEVYYPLADALVLPSDYETWGLVVLEAMSCGTPAVMTPVGCAADVIRDGVNGYVVQPCSDDIAAKIQLLMTSDRIDAIRDGARQTALGFGWEASAAAYLKIVESLPVAAVGPHES